MDASNSAENCEADEKTRQDKTMVKNGAGASASYSYPKPLYPYPCFTIN